MPYGVDKDIGGDSPTNVKFMERCVSSVMKTGKDKSAAVAICKASLKKNKGKHSDASFDISLYLWNELNNK